MLDFSKLRTPGNDGEVLVVPAAKDWLPLAERNRAELNGVSTPFLGVSLAEWRCLVRASLLGNADDPVVVTGHQPAFIHPGVWAKEVVSARLASRMGGRAVNLVVDSDLPKETQLLIPMLRDGGIVSATIAVPFVENGVPFECGTNPSLQELEIFECDVAEVMGDRFAKSLMPNFLGSLARTGGDADFVDRWIGARQSVNQVFGVSVKDVRVSRPRRRPWWTPLLLDMFFHAERFAAAYNKALADYRGTHRIRGAVRPMPDLQITPTRCELPVWAFRPDLPKLARRRVYLARQGGSLVFFANDEPVGVLPEQDHITRTAEVGFGALTAFGSWEFRPRALPLTIWTRLLLADLFIHGIGGAKYDRISDAIISDYYGIRPPAYVCVSATLWMDLPRFPNAGQAYLDLRHAARDLAFNPQRHFQSDGDISELLAERRDAIERSGQLRQNDPASHAQRRAVFERIRHLNESILSKRPSEVASIREAVGQGGRQARQSELASNREWFFVLHDRSRLQHLLDVLPVEWGVAISFG